MRKTYSLIMVLALLMSLGQGVRSEAASTPKNYYINAGSIKYKSVSESFIRKITFKGRMIKIKGSFYLLNNKGKHLMKKKSITIPISSNCKFTYGDGCKTTFAKTKKSIRSNNNNTQINLIVKVRNGKAVGIAETA